MDILDLSNDNRYLSLLRNAQTGLQAANRKKGKKPAIKMTRGELSRDQLIFQYKPDIANNQSNQYQLNISYISHKYPPSVAPLSALVKTYINDLRLETNHRGSYVLLRTIGPPSKMGAVMNAVEDENGGCDLIQLYNTDEDRDPRKILPEGQVLIVKEPFYKENTTKGTSIRVDHVSDVIFLNAGDSRIPLKWQPRITPVDKTAADWKEEGNNLFRSGEFHEAIECYTKGLEAAEEITKTLRLNRSQALLSIGLHDKALEDSDYVLQSDPTNEKALFRGAKALYLARNFEACKSRLATHVKTYPRNKEAKATLLKVYQRLQEQQTGKYDFKEMRALTSDEQKGSYKLDCADFIGPVHLQETINSGRGLFATRDVKFGELLLCEKAFHVCYPETDGKSLIIDLTRNQMQMSSGSQLVSGIVQKLYKNPSTSEKFLQLFSGNYERVKSNEADGRLIVDTFLTHEIRNINSFGCPTPGSANKNTPRQASENSGGIGIWAMASFINHACQGAGSARRSFIGDMMIVRAAKDIKKGEEITHSYYHADDVNKRREAILKHWGFLCNCSLCTTESKETPAIQKSRQTQLITILNSNATGGNPTVALRKFIQSIRSLEATYTKPATEQPRYAVFDALKHLVEMQLGTLEEILETLKCVVEALGYKIRESEGKVSIAQHGSISGFLPEVFNQCSMAYTLWGKFSMAKSYHELAVGFWEVIFGDRESFYEKYPNHFADKKIVL